MAIPLRVRFELLGCAFMRFLKSAGQNYAGSSDKATSFMEIMFSRGLTTLVPSGCLDSRWLRRRKIKETLCRMRSVQIGRRYTPEYWRQMVELHRSGRGIAKLSNARPHRCSPSADAPTRSATPFRPLGPAPGPAAPHAPPPATIPPQIRRPITPGQPLGTVL